MPYTTYLDNALVGHAVGKTSFTMPNNYVALFTSAPTTSGGGTETTYTNYARVSGVSWGSVSGGSVSNSSAVTFPACGTTGATIVAFGVYDASSGGNLLYYGSCSLTVSSGITPNFAVGALTVSQT